MRSTQRRRRKEEESSFSEEKEAKRLSAVDTKSLCMEPAEGRSKQRSSFLKKRTKKLLFLSTRRRIEPRQRHKSLLLTAGRAPPFRKTKKVFL
jgi:hypothetical protein